jgi:heme/copper-type cytochrome/quinol oxidase subunit 2
MTAETRKLAFGALWRKPPRPVRLAFTTALAVVAGGSSSLLACPVCFGAEETPMIDGAKLGVLVMLVITLTVQGAFAGFFFYLRKRAKRMADLDVDIEWADLQRSPRTS